MLTFAQPLFLWGLLLAGAPLIIHLAHRQMAQPLVFPSIRFLKVGTLPRTRRQQPRDWWLLLLRTLLLALLALLLAQPHWAAPAASGRLPVVYLVDRSASMAWLGRDESLNTALQADLVSAQRAGPLGLIVFDDVLRQALAPGMAREADILNALEDFPPRYGQARVALAWAQASDWLAETGGTVVMVTDRQAGQWRPELLQPLPQGVHLAWLEPGSFAPNTVLAHCEVRQVGEHKRLLVSLRHDGPHDTRGTVRMIDAQGQSLLEEMVELPARKPLVLNFGLPATSSASGMVSWTPEEGEDGLLEDNRRHVWLAPPPPVGIAHWVADEVNAAQPADFAFVRRALLAIQGQAGAQSFRWQSPEMEPPAPVIFVEGALDSLPEQATAYLADLVRAGASAIITPGENPARRYRLLREHGLAQVRYRGTQQGSPMGFRGFLAPPALGSPLAEVFSGEAADSLALVQLHQWDALELTGTEAVLWLATEDGLPVLIEQPLGQGRVWLFATPLNPTGGDLALSSAFVPLLQEVFMQAAPQVASTQGRAAGLAEDGDTWLRPGVDAGTTPPTLVTLAEVESVARTTPMGDFPSAPEAAPSAAQLAGWPLAPWLGWLLLTLWLAEHFLAHRNPSLKHHA